MKALFGQTKDLNYLIKDFKVFLYYEGKFKLKYGDNNIIGEIIEEYQELNFTYNT